MARSRCLTNAYWMSVLCISVTSHPVCLGVSLHSSPGSPEVAGFKSLFIRCIEYLKDRLRLQTSHKKRSHPECWISSFGSETPAGGPNLLPGRRRRSATLGIERARAGAGSSLIAVFPPSCLPGEFSREKPGEDGRALFFGVRQWRRLRRWGRES